MKSAKEVLDALDRISKVNEQLWYVRERILKNGEGIDVDALAESTKKSLGDKGDGVGAPGSSSSSMSSPSSSSSSKQKKTGTTTRLREPTKKTPIVAMKTTTTIPTSPPWISTGHQNKLGKTVKVPMPSLCGYDLILTLISTGRLVSSIDRWSKSPRKRKAYKPLSARVGQNTRGSMWLKERG